VKWWNKAVAFLSEVRAEMKKVTFPSRDEVVGTTVVVLITSVVFALYLYVADVVISGAWTFLLKVLG
jgi:preprotein translocase subunit SecE